jgi:hypothetical protein
MRPSPSSTDCLKADGVCTNWGFQAHRQSPPSRLRPTASKVRLLPSTSITRLPRYYEPLRHPIRPGLVLASCRLMLILPAPPLGLPVLRLFSYVCMLSSLPRQDCWKLFAPTLPAAAAFPRRKLGRLLHCDFRGLLNVYPCYGLHTHRVAFTTLSTEGFSDFVASTAASVVTGWNEPVPGRGYLPLKNSALPRRTPSTALRSVEKHFHEGSAELQIPRLRSG